MSDITVETHLEFLNIKITKLFFLLTLQIWN